MKASYAEILLFLAALLAQNETLASHEACSKAETADVLFLIDESGSVGERDFEKVKDFIYNVVRTFENVKTGETSLRLGVVLYGDMAR
ncbi:collagen alpha-1(XXI) chain-like [Pogona vitticeps]